MIFTDKIRLETEGPTDILDITSQVERAVAAAQIHDGAVTIFCPGSTGGLTTIEYERGVIADIQRILDEIVPPDHDYDGLSSR